MKKYSFFIGIDISKKWIDVAFTRDGKEKAMLHQRFSNNLKGFVKMFKWLLSHSCSGLKHYSLFCMEHTGVYTIPLCVFLQEQKLDYVLESALRIKRSLGIRRGKDDKADSKAIARYAYLNRNDLTISRLPSQVLIDLKDLLAYRDRLIRHEHSLKVSSKESKIFSQRSNTRDWILGNSQERIAQTRAEIKHIEKKLKELIKSDQELSRIYKLVCSVKGIGMITGLQIIIHTNCFKAFENSRQFACYIGTAPFHKKSGTSLNIQAKVSSLGHKKIKALLSNCLQAAIQHDKEIKAYYNRKIEQGKVKYKVYNAIKNKLISRVFATVKRGTPYVEICNYV